MTVSGKGVAYTTAGFVLAWSGIKGNSIKTTLTDLLKGQNPPKTSESSPQIGVAPADTAGTSSTGSSSAPEAPSTLSANETLGKLMASAYGWGSGPEWDALYDLWERESGWSNTVSNPSSGAYGIAQALGHGPTNQYPAGPANPPPAGTSSASAQIAWGLNYIKTTKGYGTPIAAWQHEVSQGWY